MIDLCIVPSGLGANRKGFELLLNRFCQYLEFSKTSDVSYSIIEPICVYNKLCSYPKIYNLHELCVLINNIKQTALDLFDKGNIPFFIGGDHSISLGLIRASQSISDTAVIYIDAHADLNTHRTSNSNNFHGMSLASACGLGHRSLRSVGPEKIKFDNIYLIGTRSFDSFEEKIINSLNISCFTVEHVRSLNICNIVNAIVNDISKKGITRVHLSIDVDVLDPHVFPSTGVPEVCGLIFTELECLINTILLTDKITSVDIVEYNPIFDCDFKSFNVWVQLLNTIFSYINNKPLY